ncbi:MULTISPECIES: hypothetical protein [unclassified Sphingomonas]|jgi:hypothetical protein|uniref:hypothetical protein n=1 Tax=unclassified Sphingomonas TaxID=196159 RepID=UPI000AB2D326|nr:MULTISPECIES: hypothetical protein [unclassified Sphingomonas]
MSSMTIRRWVFSIVAVAIPASADAAVISWGRAGVSLVQYRADAVECGKLGANADISKEPATQAIVAAEQFTERNLNASIAGSDPALEQALMARRLSPAKKLAEAQGVMLTATELCLTRLGYHRFTLTSDQSGRLGRLRLGSPERHAYLHALASDPAILAKQAVRPTAEVATPSDR